MWHAPVLLPKGWAWYLQKTVFGQNLPVQRLHRITASCPPGYPATPLPPMWGASRGTHYLPERTAIGLSAFCRCGHNKDQQTPLTYSPRINAGDSGITDPRWP